jgi:hypothetical protein
MLQALLQELPSLDLLKEGSLLLLAELVLELVKMLAVARDLVRLSWAF